jgi:hypothetical protein
VDESELNLQKEKERREQRQEEVRKLISESQALLTMHLKSVEQAGALEPERLRLKQEPDNWTRLNSIIGSADGKLFSEIAQCYTFSVLVGYANRHLKDLSTRYRLRNKPGTLTLEIIDRDMLDQTWLWDSRRSAHRARRSAVCSSTKALATSTRQASISSSTRCRRCSRPRAAR